MPTMVLDPRSAYSQNILARASRPRSVSGLIPVRGDGCEASPLAVAMPAKRGTGGVWVAVSALEKKEQYNERPRFRDPVH